MRMNDFQEKLTSNVAKVMFCAYKESERSRRVASLLLREAAIMMQEYEGAEIEESDNGK